MRILLLSDIHGNYPALLAVARAGAPWDMIINCGDSTVYAPFPGEVIDWLRREEAVSILGNTDRKVLKLLRGKTFKKPRKPDKRVMYTHTAAQLDGAARQWLAGLPSKRILDLGGRRLGIFHGSPEHHNEFLFNDTPGKRFAELARTCPCDIIITGHSHTPYVKKIAGTWFINPGSVGRMFDGNPAASYALLELDGDRVRVGHHRQAYDVEAVVQGIKGHLLPAIYVAMYRQGRKLN